MNKCGVTLHSTDLKAIFQVFDKNNTGLIDYDNFAQSLVHRVPGIKTENLTVTHLIKHTISVNFGTAAGKKGADDTYTKVQMAITSAFEEINVSQTGAITLNEFKIACKKNDIEMYGGVTNIFDKISKNGTTITLPDFVAAFQGTISTNRSEAPKLKEVLNNLKMIQWTLGDTSDGGNFRGGAVGGGTITDNEYGQYVEDEESVVVVKWYTKSSKIRSSSWTIIRSNT